MLQLTLDRSSHPGEGFYVRDQASLQYHVYTAASDLV